MSAPMQEYEELLSLRLGLCALTTAKLQRACRWRELEDKKVGDLDAVQRQRARDEMIVPPLWRAKHWPRGPEMAPKWAELQN